MNINKTVSMLSSTSDAELIGHLKRLISQINFYFGSLIFFIGIIGNILNILILSQRSLRSNTCVMIFIASSITGIITILSGLISRILSNRDLDISNTVRWICKLRAFLLYTFRLITFWLIMLATIDRWIVSSTNARVRHLSSMKNVLRSIYFITILSIIIHLHLFYCFETNVINAPLRCFARNKYCRLVDDLIFAVVTILLPLILIAVFGSMTILNIRSSQARVQPTTKISIISHRSQLDQHHQQQRFKTKDHSLFIMLFIQVILFAWLTLPLAIQKLYATFTMNVTKSALHKTIENFIFQITLLMTFIATGMQFYVNTLSGGRVFRKALIDLLQLIIRKIMRQ